MPAPVTCISLDAAGTLVTVAEPVGLTYSTLAARHGITVTPEQLGAGFRRVYPRMSPLAFGALSGAALHVAEREWWHRLVAQVFGEAARTRGFDAFFDEVFEHYAAATAWRAYPEVPGLLDALGERGLRRVVTSNFDSRLHGVLDGLGLRDRVDAVVCSTEAGSAKPDAAVFHAACAAVAATAERTLHVGDDRRADYDGARAAGLRALLLDRDARAPLPEHCIASLAEVLDTLD